MPKAFSELTTEEATKLAKDCVCRARSDQEVKDNLTKAGFPGDAAAVCSISCGPMYTAMVLVWGPRAEVILV